MKKQILSIVIMIVMVMGIIPIGTISADNSGNGWSFDSAKKTLTITDNEGASAWRDSNELNLEEIETIVIGSAVTSIEDNIFADCYALKNFNVDSNNLDYKSNNGVLYNKSETEFLRYPPSKNGNSCTILKTVTLVHDYAFDGAGALTSIKISDNAVSIGAYAFRDCVLLKNLTIPAKVEYIGENAFYNCPAVIEYLGNKPAEPTTTTTSTTTSTTTTTITEPTTDTSPAFIVNDYSYTITNEDRERVFINKDNVQESQILNNKNTISLENGFAVISVPVKIKNAPSAASFTGKFNITGRDSDRVILDIAQRYTLDGKNANRAFLNESYSFSQTSIQSSGRFSATYKHTEENIIPEDGVIFKLQFLVILDDTGQDYEFEIAICDVEWTATNDDGNPVILGVSTEYITGKINIIDNAKKIKRPAFTAGSIKYTITDEDRNRTSFRTPDGDMLKRVFKDATAIGVENGFAIIKVPITVENALPAIGISGKYIITGRDSDRVVIDIESRYRLENGSCYVENKTHSEGTIPFGSAGISAGYSATFDFNYKDKTKNTAFKNGDVAFYLYFLVVLDEREEYEFEIGISDVKWIVLDDNAQSVTANVKSYYENGKMIVSNPKNTIENPVFTVGNIKYTITDEDRNRTSLANLNGDKLEKIPKGLGNYISTDNGFAVIKVPVTVENALPAVGISGKYSITGRDSDSVVLDLTSRYRYENGSYYMENKAISEGAIPFGSTGISVADAYFEVDYINEIKNTAFKDGDVAFYLYFLVLFDERDEYEFEIGISDVKWTVLDNKPVTSGVKSYYENGKIIVSASKIIYPMDLAKFVTTIKISMSIITVSNSEIPFYDMNNDNKIDIIDVALARRKLLSNY